MYNAITPIRAPYLINSFLAVNEGTFNGAPQVSYLPDERVTITAVNKAHSALTPTVLDPKYIGYRRTEILTRLSKSPLQLRHNGNNVDQQLYIDTYSFTQADLLYLPNQSFPPANPFGLPWGSGKYVRTTNLYVYEGIPVPQKSTYVWDGRYKFAVDLGFIPIDPSSRIPRIQGEARARMEDSRLQPKQVTSLAGLASTRKKPASGVNKQSYELLMRRFLDTNYNGSSIPPIPKSLEGLIGLEADTDENGVTTGVLAAQLDGDYFVRWVIANPERGRGGSLYQPVYEIDGIGGYRERTTEIITQQTEPQFTAIQEQLDDAIANTSIVVELNEVVQGPTSILNFTNASIVYNPLTRQATVTFIAPNGGDGVFISQDGGTYGNKTRFINFNNLQVELNQYGTVADVTWELELQDEGVSITTAPKVIDFTGSVNLSEATPGVITVDVLSGSAVEVLDEGVSLTSAVSSLDFVGAQVTVTNVGTDVVVTIVNELPPQAGNAGRTLFTNGTSPSWEFIESTDINDSTLTGRNLLTAATGSGFIVSTIGVISYDPETYTPESRTLTINGVPLDLSADRSWTVAAAGYIVTPVKVANYTAVNYDAIPCDTSAGPFTITLPTGGALQVRIFDNVGNLPTEGFGVEELNITPDVGDTIMGGTGLILDVGGIGIELYLVGNDWRIVNATSELPGSGGGGGGSEFTTIATQTANYTAVTGNRIPCDTSGGSFTITLPVDGIVSIFDEFGNLPTTGFGANSLNIVPVSGTVMGGPSLVMDVGATSVELELVGTDWRIIDGGSSSGDSSYTYIAYASDAIGTGFTTTFSAALDFIAIKTTTTEILSPNSSDFTGLWKNYRGADGVDGSSVPSFTYKSFNNTGVTISTSAAETDIINLTIPANTLTSDGDSISIDSLGTYLNNTGANQNFILRIKVGGTTVFNDATGNIASSATSRVVTYTGKIIRTSTTTAEIQLLATINAVTATTTGQSDLGASALRVTNVVATASVAWTWANATTFALTIQQSSSAATHVYTHLYHLLTGNGGTASSSGGLSYIPISTNQTLDANNSYLATIVGLVATLPTAPNIGVVIGLSTGNFAFTVLHGNASQRIFNISNLTIADVANGIYLKPRSSVNLIYEGANVWVTQQRARTINNWIGNPVVPAPINIVSYTPTNFNAFNEQFATLPTDINDGDIIPTGIDLTRGLLSGSADTQILVTFASPTILQSIDLYIGQDNTSLGSSTVGLYGVDTLRIYGGNSLTTLLATINPVRLAACGISQVFNVLNSTAYTQYIFRFEDSLSQVGVLELVLYDIPLTGGEVLAT